MNYWRSLHIRIILLVTMNPFIPPSSIQICTLMASVRDVIVLPILPRATGAVDTAMEIAADTVQYRRKSLGSVQYSSVQYRAHLGLKRRWQIWGAGPIFTQTLENYPAPGTFEDDHLPTWPTQTTTSDISGHILTYHLKLKYEISGDTMLEYQWSVSLDHN